MRDTIRKSANRYSRAPRVNRRSTAANDRMAAVHAEASDALKHNRCPTCAGPMRQNLSLTGWVQCAQYGAEGFRLDSKRPACGWQGFTS